MVPDPEDPDDEVPPLTEEDLRYAPPAIGPYNPEDDD